MFEDFQITIFFLFLLYPSNFHEHNPDSIKLREMKKMQKPFLKDANYDRLSMIVNRLT